MIRIGIYAGCFDPLTNGHMWMISEGKRLFDKLYVLIGENQAKDPTFAKDDRLAVLRECVADVDTIVSVLPENIVVHALKIAEAYKGLDTDIYLLRGIRTAKDFTYEENICQNIRRIDDNINHVFLIPPESFVGVSSTEVKEQWVRYGWDMTSHLVPEATLKMMKTYQDQNRSGFVQLCDKYDVSPVASIFEQTTAGFAPSNIYGGFSPSRSQIKMTSVNGHQMELEDAEETICITAGRFQSFHEKAVKNGFIKYAGTVTATQVKGMLDLEGVNVISSEKFHLREIDIESVTPTGYRYLPCSHSLGPIIVDLKTSDLADIDVKKILGDAAIIEGKHRWLDAKDRGDKKIWAWVGEEAFKALNLS